MKLGRTLNLLAVTQPADPGFTKYAKPYFAVQENGDAAFVSEDDTVDPVLRGWVDEAGNITKKGAAEVRIVKL